MNSSDMVFVAVEHISATDRQGRALSAEDVEDIWTETLKRFRALRNAARAVMRVGNEPVYGAGPDYDAFEARLADADEWLAGVATGL